MSALGRSLFVVVLSLLIPALVFAQTEGATSDPSTAPSASASSSASAAASEDEVKAPITNVSEGASKTSSKANVTFSGYVEGFYQYNFNNPSNGITNYRGFDTRHNSLTLANAVFDSSWSLDRVTGRLALQIGHTGETYYLAEPSSRGASGAGVSNYNVWKFIQQANVSWKAPIGRGLLLDAGIFLSPIGPEGMVVKDQWNWSRSNLFFGLPFYHTGARATYALTNEMSVTAHVYNGWNSVVDGNRFKSVAASFTYSKQDKITFQALYFGGVERPTGSPETTNGAPWRHLLDTYVAVYATSRLSFLVHGNVGMEKNSYGTSWWGAAAAYARFKATPWLSIALRGDRFYEKSASNSAGTASSIFWPTKETGPHGGVTSGTFTLDARPADNISIRLEYRHDRGDANMYFKNDVPTDATTGAYVMNAKQQNTLLLGIVTWF